MKKSQVIEHFGSALSLAVFLGLNKSAVSQWGNVIPEKQALRLERLTNGELKYEPNLYK